MSNGSQMSSSIPCPNELIYNDFYLRSQTKQYRTVIHFQIPSDPKEPIFVVQEFSLISQDGTRLENTVKDYIPPDEEHTYREWTIEKARMYWRHLVKNGYTQWK